MIGNIAIIASLLITTLLFGISKIQFAILQPTVWQMLAQITGLLGLTLLSWSFVLAIRHSILEKMFGGLDKVYRIHHLVGGAAFILLINHPLLLIINGLPSNMLKLYLVPGTMLDYTSGIVALYLMLLLIFLTLFVDLPYALWKQTHEWMGLVIALGGIHGLLITSDISRYLPLRIWILGLAIIAIVAYVYKRYLYYYVTPAKNFRLVECRRDGDVLIVSVAPVNANYEMKFTPGQYAFLTIEGQKAGRDEHPFSVVRQENGVVQFGVKAVGKFTLALAGLPVNTNLTIRGPYGRFGEVAERGNELVMIAGGIGITPFVPILKELKPEQKAILFHTSKGICSPYIAEVIKAYTTQNPNLEYIEHDSASGRLTARMIQEKAKMNNAKYMLCGPVPMMESITEQLVSLGVLRKRIIYEDFTFR
jgi:predicted ferric reductase